MANTITPKPSVTTLNLPAPPAPRPAAPERAAAPEAPGDRPAAAPPAPAPAPTPPRAGASPLHGGLVARPAPDLGKAVPANPRDMDIVCPVLGALVAEGRVKLAADGTMKFDDLRKALDKDLGMSPAVREATLSTGLIANRRQQVLHNLTHQEMNVLDLRAGMIKHPGDSAILTGGRFDEQKFQTFAAHAEYGVMTVDSFARAVVDQYRRDDVPGQHADARLRGLNFAQVEYTALLSVFGHMDPATGKLGIAVDDLRKLFEHKQLPAHLTDRAGLPGTTDIAGQLHLKVTMELTASAFRSLATATGVAQAGARLAAGEPDRPSRGAAAGAGSAAGCPYFAGLAKMPGNPNDVVAAHLPETR